MADPELQLNAYVTTAEKDLICNELNRFASSFQNSEEHKKCAKMLAALLDEATPEVIVRSHKTFQAFVFPYRTIYECRPNSLRKNADVEGDIYQKAKDHAKYVFGQKIFATLNFEHNPHSKLTFESVKSKGLLLKWECSSTIEMIGDENFKRTNRKPLVGRDHELSQLCKPFIDSKPFRIMLVHGRQGNGKSALVEELLGFLKQQPQGSPYNVCIVETLQESLPMRVLLSRIGNLLSAKQKGKQLDPSQDIADLVSEVRLRLAKRKAILILDNFESALDADNGDSIYPDFKPLEQLLKWYAFDVKSEETTLILTSRRKPKICEQFSNGVTELRLAELPEDVCLTLAKNEYPDLDQNDPSRDWKQLVRLGQGNAQEVIFHMRQVLAKATEPDAFRAYLKTHQETVGNFAKSVIHTFHHLPHEPRALMAFFSLCNRPIHLGEADDDSGQTPVSVLRWASDSDWCDALQTLLRQGLIEEKAGAFGLQQNIKEITRQGIVELVFAEIRAIPEKRHSDFLESLPLCRANQPLYLRMELQKEILTAVLRKMGFRKNRQSEQDERIIREILERLNELKGKSGNRVRFEPGNLVQLLIEASPVLDDQYLDQLYLSDVDFSDVTLKQTIFANSEFVRCRFGEVFGGVWSLSTIQDVTEGTIIVGGDGNGSVYVWDNTFRTRFNARLHDNIVFACIISPNGAYLLTAGAQGDLQLWKRIGFEIGSWQRDNSTKLPIHPIRVYRLAFDPAGQKLLSGDNNGHVYLTLIGSGVKQEFLHLGEIRGLVFWNEAEFYVGAANQIYHYVADPTGLFQLKPASGLLIDHVDFNNQGEGSKAATATIRSMVRVPNTRFLIIGLEDGRALSWNVEDPSQIDVWHWKDEQLTGAVITGLAATAPQSDGNSYVAIGGDRGLMWKMIDESGEWVTDQSKTLLGPDSGTLTAVAIPAGGNSLIVGFQECCLTGFDISKPESPQILRRMPGLPIRIKAYSHHPTLPLLVTGGEDNRIRVWDTATQTEQCQLHPQNGSIWSVVFSQNGQMLAVGDVKGRVQLFHFVNQQWSEPIEFAPHAGAIMHYGITFDPSGELMATGAEDGFVKIWQCPSLKQFPREVFSARVEKRVWVLRFSPTGKSLACGLDNGDVIIYRRHHDSWNGHQTVISKAHQHQIWDIRFIHDDVIITAGRDGKIATFDSTAHEISSFRLMKEVPRSGLMCIRLAKDLRSLIWLHPDSRTLTRNEIQVSADGQFKLNPNMKTVSVKDSWIWEMDYQPDHHLLSAADVDGKVYLWSEDSEAPLICQVPRQYQNANFERAKLPKSDRETIKRLGGLL